MAIVRRPDIWVGGRHGVRFAAVGVLCALAVAACVPLSGTMAQEGSTSEQKLQRGTWSYRGSTGPEHWGNFPGYDKCSRGQSQSPIDLPKLRAGSGKSLKVRYLPTWWRLEHTKHTVLASFPPGSELTYGSEVYELKRFEFRTPSEHTVDGEQFAAELQFVHADEYGDLAIVSVFFDIGEHNSYLHGMLSNIPEPAMWSHGPNSAKPMELLPKDLSSYRYTGSLTFPPCTEDVLWFVLKNPVTMSQEQLETLRAGVNGNNRPLQELHDRTVALVDGPEREDEN